MQITSSPKIAQVRSYYANADLLYTTLDSHALTQEFQASDKLGGLNVKIVLINR